MKRKLSLAVLASLGAFVLVALSGVSLPRPAHAQASPSVAVSLSSASVEEGTAITVTMSFSGLESDSDTATTDFVFRADVVDADGCEDRAGGYGLGVDRYMHEVDQDTEVRTGSVSADCPAGDYTVEVSVSSPDGAELASVRASFAVRAPAAEPTPMPERAPQDEETPDGGESSPQAETSDAANPGTDFAVTALAAGPTPTPEPARQVEETPDSGGSSPQAETSDTANGWAATKVSSGFFDSGSYKAIVCGPVPRRP